MNQWKEEKDSGFFFIINLHEGMGQSWDQTHDLWISNQTHYQLPYRARLLLLKLNNTWEFTSILVLSLHESVWWGKKLWKYNTLVHFDPLTNHNLRCFCWIPISVEPVYSPWSILQYFWPALRDNQYWKNFGSSFYVSTQDRFYCTTVYHHSSIQVLWW